MPLSSLIQSRRNIGAALSLLVWILALMSTGCSLVPESGFWSSSSDTRPKPPPAAVAVTQLRVESDGRQATVYLNYAVTKAGQYTVVVTSKMGRGGGTFMASANERALKIFKFAPVRPGETVTAKISGPGGEAQFRTMAQQQ